MSNRDEDDEQETAPKPFCPRCGSTDIRTSKSHRKLDFLLRSFSLQPHRCRSCRKRFYMRKQAPPQIDLPEDPDPQNNNAADSKANS